MTRQPTSPEPEDRLFSIVVAGLEEIIAYAEGRKQLRITVRTAPGHHDEAGER